MIDFTEVINDVERLVGRKLAAINPTTGYVEIVDVNRETNNYHLKLNNGKPQSRSFMQLELIWNVLIQERVANVETVLEGSGSSRHIPETILANLPYIQHFKYKRKKHLYLDTDSIHDLGTLVEVSSRTQRLLKSKLDNLIHFDRISFLGKLKSTIDLLDNATEELSIKFPGDFEAAKISKVEENLSNLLEEVSKTVIPRNETTDRNYINIASSEHNAINLDTAEFTGFSGGDVISIEGQDDTDNSLPDDKEMSSSRIRFLPTTVSLIYDRILHEEMELQPEFQRKDRIWPAASKSALIESILMGLPIPTFFFAERPSGIYVIVDGLQRITTFYDFIGDKFSLEGLKFRKEFNGLTFKDLPRPEQRKIREYQIHAYVIAIQKDNDEMVRELFQRINTYGVKMSYQEIRCALYPGSSVRFLKYLAESPAFLQTTFGKVQPKRMRDMELVLGAVTFTLLGYKKFDEKKFDDYLTKCMKILNREKIAVSSGTHENSNSKLISADTSPLYLDISDRICASFGLANDIFGIDRYKKEISGTVINKSLFELVVATFALLQQGQRDRLLAQRELVKTRFYNLLSGLETPKIDWETENYKGRDFEYSITQSTGKKTTILYRFGNTKALLEDILGEAIDMGGLLKQYDNSNLS